MFNLFKTQSLVELKDFETSYTIKVQNQLTLKKERPPVSLTTISQMFFKQEIKDKNIINTTKLIEVKGDTDDDEFRPYLEKNLILSDISKKFYIQRNSKGEIKAILNKEELKKDWQIWKKKKLYPFIQKLREQERFIQAYEKGLSVMEGNIKHELQSIALFPECYFFKNYISSQKEYTSLYRFSSRMIKNLEIKYKFTPVKIHSSGAIVHIEMESAITNLTEISSSINKINSFPNTLIQFKTETLLTFKIRLMERKPSPSKYKCKACLFTVFEYSLDL